MGGKQKIFETTIQYYTDASQVVVWDFHQQCILHYFATTFTWFMDPTLRYNTTWQPRIPTWGILPDIHQHVPGSHVFWLRRTGGTVDFYIGSDQHINIHITAYSWWFFTNPSEKYVSSNCIRLPQFLGWRVPKCLSCHYYQSTHFTPFQNISDFPKMTTRSLPTRAAARIVTPRTAEGRTTGALR